MKTRIDRRRQRLAWIVNWAAVPGKHEAGERKFPTREAALEYLRGPRVATRGATLTHVDRAGWRTPIAVP